MELAIIRREVVVRPWRAPPPTSDGRVVPDHASSSARQNRRDSVPVVRLARPASRCAECAGRTRCRARGSNPLRERALRARAAHNVLRHTSERERARRHTRSLLCCRRESSSRSLARAGPPSGCPARRAAAEGGEGRDDSRQRWQQTPPRARARVARRGGRRRIRARDSACFHRSDVDVVVVGSVGSVGSVRFVTPPSLLSPRLARPARRSTFLSRRRPEPDRSSTTRAKRSPRYDEDHF